LSVAFVKEESAEAASETLLPDRPVSPHPNLVTEEGLKALEQQLSDARAAYEAAAKIEDVNERRRQQAGPLRDLRYFAERVHTAQLVPAPETTERVAFGSTVTFSRDDGRVQTYRIVGEDEADPKAGSDLLRLSGGPAPDRQGRRRRGRHGRAGAGDHRDRVRRGRLTAG